jgi:hypothetical protein
MFSIPCLRFSSKIHFLNLLIAGASALMYVVHTLTKICFDFIPVGKSLKIRQKSNLRHKTTAYLLHF